MVSIPTRFVLERSQVKSYSVHIPPRAGGVAVPVNLSAIAKELLVSPSYVSKVINGRMDPSISMGARLADVLGMSLDTLLLIIKERVEKRRNK